MDYALLELRALVGEDTGYQDPLVDFMHDVASRTTQVQRHRVTSTATIDLTSGAFFNDSEDALLVVYNRDTTNAVNVDYQGAQTQANRQVPAGQLMVVPDCRASADVTVTAVAGTPICDVWVLQ